MSLLDLSKPEVQQMIDAAKVHGYVTLDALNALLPKEQASSEQVDDTAQTGIHRG